MGPFALRLGGLRQPLHLAGNSLRLLMLLAAHHDRGVRRDRLIDVIFPEQDAGRAASALNTAVWRIKNCLAPHEGLGIECIDAVVRLRVTPPACVDTQRIEAAVLAATAAPPGAALDCALRRELILAVEGGRGVFLEGVNEHWVLPLRERYSAVYIEALTLLMRDAAARSEFERALTHGREILGLDPFREGMQCEVMWLYFANGQRVQALRQFRSLEALLKEELGIEPIPEARALFESIRRAAPVPPPGGAMPWRSADPLSALREG